MIFGKPWLLMALVVGSPSSLALSTESGSGMSLVQIFAHKYQNESLPTAATMTEELSNILPNHWASVRTRPGMTKACPEVPGYEETVESGAEVVMCAGLVTRDEKEGKCLIYNFGVGTQDDFLEMLGERHPDCKVYGFDPFFAEEDFASRGGSKAIFGENFEFRSWGLWDGVSTRQEGKGELLSFNEIQEKLGHKGQYFTIVRSDCEGCEYGWIDMAIKEDPTLFQRIGQMFIEIHFAPDPRPRYSKDVDELMPPVYNVLTKNFKIIEGMKNPGDPEDRYRVDQDFVQMGVNSWPCCVEMTLVGNHLMSSAPRAAAEDVKIESFGKFKAYEGKCEGKVRSAGAIKFCGDELKREEATGRCLVYVFGASSADEVKLLQMLGTDYQGCRVIAMDPRKSRDSWRKQGGVRKFFGENVEFEPWGLYSGSGSAQIRTQDPELGQIVGGLYSMDEISRGHLIWSNQTINCDEAEETHMKHWLTNQGHISLLRPSCLEGQDCLPALASAMQRGMYSPGAAGVMQMA